MRLLQVMAGAKRGGAETYFVNLAGAFERAAQAGADLEQRVVIRHQAEREVALRMLGIEPVQYDFGGLFDFGTGWRLGRLARQFKPDIVLTWMTRATQKMPRGNYPIIARLGGYYDLKGYAKADWLVANTPDIARHCVENGFREDRVRCIANFGSFNKAAPVPRESLGTPSGVPLLLAMGRLHPNKAFDTLLKALAELPEAYLWLAGAGEEEGALKSLAEQLNIQKRVRFLGWRQDREALAAACDVYVVPSRHEPFGNVLLDAWGAGKPLVATSSEGPKQYVEEGVSGLLVPVDHPVKLAGTIREVLRLPELAQRLSLGGRRQFERDHAEGPVVAQWMKLFEEVKSCAA